MTQHRARKQATRLRVAETGENYTTARRRLGLDELPFAAQVPAGINPDDTNIDELLDADWNGEGRWTYAEGPHDNRRRAGFALEAVGAFAKRTGDIGEPEETIISDLLGDLRHLCDALGLDLDGLVESGRHHHDAEIRGEF